MIRDTDNIFREEQKFGLRLRWLVYVSMGMAVVISVFALIKETAPDGSQDTWEMVLAGVVGIGVPIVIAGLFFVFEAGNRGSPGRFVCALFTFSHPFQEIRAGRFERILRPAV